MDVVECGDDPFGRREVKLVLWMWSSVVKTQFEGWLWWMWLSVAITHVVEDK